MPNPYFQFKQFTIYHDRCAMKVCTDACILGAWFAEKVQFAKRILDVGTGSGLLMLMLAQKSGAEIHGIEIDAPSFAQLNENIIKTGWSDRLKTFKGDVRTHPLPVEYDFIISNPPFFENDLLAENDNSNVAKHSKQLTLEELVKTIDRNLTADGSFGILLPYHRLEYFTVLAQEYGFSLIGQLLVKQSPAHNYFRVILHFHRKAGIPLKRQELLIKDTAGSYTPEFVELLKDYYLYL